MMKLHRSSHKWIKTLAPMLLICMSAAVAARQDRQPSLTGAEQKSAPEWLKFSPEGAPFSLSLPASPSEHAKDEDSGMKVHTYKLKAGATEYSVVWFASVPYTILQRAPLNVLFPRGLEEILKSARQAGKKDLLTTHEDDITFNGYHGRESTMESGSDKIEARAFISGHDFITLAVLHPKEESFSAYAKRFLESLSLPDIRVAKSANGDAAPENGNGAIPISEVDTRPIPLNRPRPDYTEVARKHGVQGAIRARALVGLDGLVKDVRFVTHLPDGLDDQASKAIRQMQFKPATKAGQPVVTWVTVEVEFNLRKNKN